ncbi:MAG: sensor histidine kinase [Pseudohongiellaceae bacterium]
MQNSLSLRTQLLLLVGGPLLLLLAFESVVSYQIGMHITNQVFDRWLLDSAYSLVQEVKVDDSEISFIADDAAVMAFSWDELDTIHFQIADLRGNVVAGLNALEPTTPPGELGSMPVFNDIVVNGSRTRAVSILAPPGEAPSYIVTVAETLNKRQAMTGELLHEFLLSKLVLVLAILLIIAITFEKAFRPLIRIGRELDQRSPQDLAPISVGRVPGEIRGLIVNTNRLLERIDAAISAREQFIGNIAHQIRTPLAGIKLQAQLALDGTAMAEPTQTALEKIVSASDQMAHVNSQLMKLARAESAYGRGLRNETVDLASVIRNVCSELTWRAHEKDIQLLQHLPEQPCCISGEMTLITEMVANLIENAIIYGNSGGHVWVHLDTTGDGFRIEIEDDGPGIDKAHWPQIFDRFFRPYAPDTNGCGLGLSIVREIAMAHGANVYLEERAQGTGIRFVILFTDSNGHEPGLS